MSAPFDWGRMSQAERDAAYNNGAAVPERDHHVRVRNEASAIYRSAHKAHLDLAYGTGERQKWDLYPSGNPNAPCLIFIHGGYWQMNRREDFAAVAEGVGAHGWSVAMPGYTLAPDASLTAIVDELYAALDWLATHAAAHGIAGKMILSGWSAGAQLVAMHLGHPLVAAGLAISGVFELGPLRETFVDEKLKLADAEIASLSPLRLPATPKPLTIAYGTRELPALVADSRDLHALRAAAHAEGALLPIAGADHFTILHQLLSPTGLLTKAALSLV